VTDKYWWLEKRYEYRLPTNVEVGVTLANSIIPDLNDLGKQ
jgi:hypothetical protein